MNIIRFYKELFEELHNTPSKRAVDSAWSNCSGILYKKELTLLSSIPNDPLLRHLKMFGCNKSVIRRNIAYRRLNKYGLITATFESDNWCWLTRTPLGDMVLRDYEGSKSYRL